MPLLNHKIDVNVIFYLGRTSNQSPNMVVAKFQGFFPQKGTTSNRNFQCRKILSNSLVKLIGYIGVCDPAESKPGVT